METPKNARPDEYSGKILDDRYKIIEFADSGGMADIYKAEDLLHNNRIVAIKILKNELSQNADFIRRFRNETKAVSLLMHPNIVKIYDVNYGKLNYMVMEYIDGMTLSEFISQNGALSHKTALKFCLQILKALQHAHNKGIVHRDIKSQNIMFLPDGTIKVMDFGIARFNREISKTLSEKAIGSVHYISPEQAQGLDTDEKSDIYSTGVILYEMLTGKKPFNGSQPVTIALMHIQDEPPKVRELNKNIPYGIEQIVSRAMRKKPHERFRTAGDMISAIEQVLRDPETIFETEYVKSKSKPAHNTKSKAFASQNPSENSGKELNDMSSEQYEDYDEYDYDEEESVSRRSPLLPILFAVASAFVIVTSILIFKIVANTFGSIEEGGGKSISMPNLIGLDYDTAVAKYPSLNLTPVQEWSAEKPKGVIMAQSVSENRRIKSKQRVEITVSKGPKLIELANYGGGIRAKDEVINQIKKQGFSEPIIKFEESDTVPKDFVIRTDPPANEMLDENTKISVYVSSGEFGVMTDVPNLLNLSVEDARERAKQYKILLIETNVPSTPEQKGRVIKQNIDPLARVAPNTPVEVQVGSGEMAVRKGSISVTANQSVKGSYKFEYYIDGVLQEDLTKIQNIELNHDITWNFEGTGVHTYAIVFTSTDTGKSAKFCEYRFDFTTDPVTKEELYRNNSIFKDLRTTDTTESEVTETESPRQTEAATVSLPSFITAAESSAATSGTSASGVSMQ
jgi:serine/threonine-protein kinase